MIRIPKHLVSLVAVLLLALAGCGDGDGEREAGTDAQVTPGSSNFVGADLDDVPVPPLAEPLGPVQEEDGGLLVRSYAVRDSRVQDVMAFYEDLFADRPVVQPVEDAPGSSTVLGAAWQLRDGILKVTAQQAPTIDDPGSSEGNSVQLSLELDPE